MISTSSGWRACASGHLPRRSLSFLVRRARRHSRPRPMSQLRACSRWQLLQCHLRPRRMLRPQRMSATRPRPPTRSRCRRRSRVRCNNDASSSSSTRTRLAAAAAERRPRVCARLPHRRSTWCGRRARRVPLHLLLILMLHTLAMPPCRIWCSTRAHRRAH